MCLKELGPVVPRGESCIASPLPQTPSSSGGSSPVRSCRGPSSRDRGSRVSKSSRVDRESTSRPTTNSRGSAVTRRSSRARTSISSVVDSEGSDLVDVARMFSSDEEEMSESMGHDRRSSMLSPKVSPTRRSRPPSRGSGVSSMEKTSFESSVEEPKIPSPRRVTILPLSSLQPLREAQMRQRSSRVTNALGVMLVLALATAYWYLPGLRPIYCDDIMKEDCEPCPPNAECRGRSMVCKPLFKRDVDVCVRDERLYMASHHMAASLAEQLAERRGDYECYKTRYQLDQDEAKRYLRVKCREARRLGDKDFEAAFKLMLSESLPSEFGDQVVHTAGGTFWSLKSSKRIHCQIVEAIEMWWRPVTMILIIVLLAAWRLRRWSDRRWARKSALEAVTACTRLGSDGSIRGIRVRDLAVEVLHWSEGKVRTYMDELAKEAADVKSSGDGEYWSDAAVNRLVASSKEGGRSYRMF